MLDVGFTREPFRHFELRQIGFVEGQFEGAGFGDLHGVGDGRRHFFELNQRLLGGFHVELVGVEFHPVGIVDRFPGLQAEHEVVRTRVFFFQVVAVVGARERDAELLVDVEQPVVGDALVLQPVGLQFEIIIVLAENLAILACRFGGAGQIFLPDEIGDFSAQATGKADQSFVVLL